MQIEEFEKTLKIENDSIAITKTIEGNISEENIQFIFAILEKQYSNPIGSIVRELTSNCFDSHAEAEIDDPVLIKLGLNDNGYYVSFVDFGVGLSPERIEKVYMNMGSSTKRNTNGQIGMFGIGSKSPLAYTDYFEIITNVDGKKYHYIYSKAFPKPKLDLIGETDTTERNGTEVKIIIKPENQNNDLYKFCTEIKEQLVYFDNVIVDNKSYNGFEFENDYNILETKTFKYRTDTQYSEQLHIAYGKVSYPINFKELNIDEINIPVGITFEIGELVVTPSRESIEYTPQIKTLILDRINDFLNEFTEIYNNVAEKVSDIVEFYNLRKGRKRNLTLNHEGTEFKIEFTIPSEYTELFSKPVILKDFEDDDIYIPENPLFMLKDNLKRHEHGIVSNHFSSEFKTLEILADGEINNRTLIYTNSPYISISKMKYHFRNSYYAYSIPLINTKNIGYRTFAMWCNILKINEHHLGKYKIIYKYIKLINDHIKKFGKNLDTYEDVTVQGTLPKIRNKRESLKREGFILTKDIISGSQRNITLKEIDEFKGIILYGGMKDVEKLESFYKLIRNKRSFIDKYDDIRKESVMILRVAKEHFKSFTNKSLQIHIDNFMTNNRILRVVGTCFLIEEIIGKNMKHLKNNVDHYKRVSAELYNLLFRIEKYHHSKVKYDYDFIRHLRDGYSSRQHQHQAFELEILDLCKENNWFDESIIEDVYKLRDYLKDCELLLAIDITDDTIHSIAEYLKFKKKKVNMCFYKSTLQIVHNDLGKVDEEAILAEKFIEEDFYTITKEQEATDNNYIECVA